MNEQKLEHMRRYLGKAEVRKSILNDMLKWRSDIQVTIGRAASLLSLSENQLRDWEEHGLLHPARLASHRQYSFEDLDKLVIIRELINAKFAPGDIPPNIDEIANIAELRAALISSVPQLAGKSEDDFSIDQRVEQAKDEICWRFLASHIVRVSLMLISDALPNAVMGILLPFGGVSALNVEELPALGTSLIGWLSEDGSSSIFLTARPSFLYPIDYYLYPLAVLKNGEILERSEDDTLIILERKDRRSRTLSLSGAVVDLVRRLLAPLYEERQKVQKCFGSGMKDERVPTMDLRVTANGQDILLRGIANMVIRWGGYGVDGRNRWRFCIILLPDLSSRVPLPLRQQNLVVHAQSDDSPYIAGKSVFSPLKGNTSLSIRAFQSGYVIYRPELSVMDRATSAIAIEGPVRSCIAIPVGGEAGRPLAVLHVVSDESAAFPERDQQLLRIASRLIEDVLITYQAHRKEAENFKDLMGFPAVVDGLFRDFLSENNFMYDMARTIMEMDKNTLDDKIRMSSDRENNDVLIDDENILSFIALDLDDQQHLASKYGNQIMRQLSKALGLQIQKLILSLITLSAKSRLYYMRGGRFYLILQGFSLEKAREKAETLRRNIEGNISLELSARSNSLLIVPGITMHLGVTSYKYTKLKELLQRYGSMTDVCAKISQELDTVLKMGMDAGGNVVISWDPKTKGFISLGSVE